MYLTEKTIRSKLKRVSYKNKKLTLAQKNFAHSAPKALMSGQSSSDGKR